MPLMLFPLAAKCNFPWTELSKPLIHFMYRAVYYKACCFLAGCSTPQKIDESSTLVCGNWSGWSSRPKFYMPIVAAAINAGSFESMRAGAPSHCLLGWSSDDDAIAVGRSLVFDSWDMLGLPFTSWILGIHTVVPVILSDTESIHIPVMVTCYKYYR